MYIVGISAFYHDSAAVLIKNGEIIAAAQEERFTRKKHDASFPHHALQYCLKEGGIPASKIDNVVFYEKPFLKFERLLKLILHSHLRDLLALLKQCQFGLKKTFSKISSYKRVEIFS